MITIFDFEQVTLFFSNLTIVPITKKIMPSHANSFLAFKSLKQDNFCDLSTLGNIKKQCPFGNLVFSVLKFLLLSEFISISFRQVSKYFRYAGRKAGLFKILHHITKLQHCMRLKIVLHNSSHTQATYKDIKAFS